MKVAIITAFDPYVFRGGIERYTIQLIDLLKDKGADVDIYHTGLIEDDGGFYQRLIGKIYKLGKRFYEYDRYYDFLISNSFYGLGYFPPRIRSYNIYHSTHIAFDKSVEGVISPITSLELTYLCGYLGERVCGFDRINIAVSESVGEELRKYYGLNNVHIVESGVDTKLFMPLNDKTSIRKRYVIPVDAFVGLFVGRWDKTKGSDIVEDTIKRTSDIYWLLVLGTGSDPCELDGLKNVKILREIPYEEMSLIYNLSDFMLFPSRYEGFGLVMAEAIACGLPVLTGDVGIAKMIYKQEPFSRLQLSYLGGRKSDEIFNDISSKIYFLKKDRDFVRTVSMEGVKLIREKYNIDLWKEKMIEVLQLK
jgi:glycosyltransferase involved in cell wall biosynthesis